MSPNPTRKELAEELQAVSAEDAALLALVRQYLHVIINALNGVESP